MPAYIRAYSEALREIQEYGSDQNWNIQQALEENFAIVKDARPDDSREAQLRHAVIMTRSEIAEAREISEQRDSGMSL